MQESGAWQHFVSYNSIRYCTALTVSVLRRKYRDGGLPEKQVLTKLAAHYYIYLHC